MKNSQGVAPDPFYVFGANTHSSSRGRIARRASSHKQAIIQSLSTKGGSAGVQAKRSIKKNRRKAREKNSKIVGGFIHVRACPKKAVSIERMESGPVVVDGGMGDMPPIPKTVSCGGDSVELDVLSVKSSTLRKIFPSNDPELGIMLVYEDGYNADGQVENIAFAVLPQDKSSAALPLHDEHFHAELKRTFVGIQSNDSTQGRGQKRKLIFDEPLHRLQENSYPCVGAKASRSARGVTERSHHARSDPTAYNGVSRIIGKLESFWKEFLPRKEVLRVSEAYNACPWPTLMGLSDDSASRTIFSGANLSTGSYHNAHTDPDFGYSILFTFDPWRTNTGSRNDIVRWFAFPRLGVCVALRAGDILIFNPSEHHCASSLSVDRQIFSFVAYVKTSVVGGNDNSKELDDKQKEIYDAVIEEE